MMYSTPPLSRYARVLSLQVCMWSCKWSSRKCKALFQLWSCVLTKLDITLQFQGTILLSAVLSVYLFTSLRQIQLSSQQPHPSYTRRPLTRSLTQLPTLLYHVVPRSGNLSSRQLVRDFLKSPSWFLSSVTKQPHICWFLFHIWSANTNNKNRPRTDQLHTQADSEKYGTRITPDTYATGRVSLCCGHRDDIVAADV